MLHYIPFFALIFLVNCTTVPVEEPPQKSRKSSKTYKRYRRTTPAQPIEKIDLNQLQKVLRMDRGKRQLGLKIKSFNTCRVGSGFTKNSNCRRRYFSVLHFRMRCRATTGTVEQVNRYELTPMISNSIQWSLSSKTGETRTDYEGYGQITLVTESNPKRKRLIIKNKGNNLGLRAYSIRDIIVPSDWCD